MDAIYRQVIDALVQSCHSGQGQIAARKLREGVWNRNVDDPTCAGIDFGNQGAINDLLRRLSLADRELLAEMLSHEFESGVHETLVVLHERRVAPFDDGYEGDPFHDFVGRLDDWPWPVDRA